MWKKLSTANLFAIAAVSGIILLFVWAYSLKQEEKVRLEQMQGIKDGGKVINGWYGLTKTIKTQVKGTDIDLSVRYEVTYKYKVGPYDEYSGVLKLKDLPEEDSIKVYYLEENPAVHSLDIDKDLAEAKAAMGSDRYTYYMIFWSAVFLLSSFGTYKKYKEEKEKNAEIERKKKAMRG